MFCFFIIIYSLLNTYLILAIRGQHCRLALRREKPIRVGKYTIYNIHTISKYASTISISQGTLESL